MRWIAVCWVVVACALGAVAQESADSTSSSSKRYCPDSPFSVRLTTIHVDGTRDDVFSGSFQAARQLVGNQALRGLDLGLEFSAVDDEPACFTVERKVDQDAEVDPRLTSIRMVYQTSAVRITVDYDPSSVSSITQVDSASDDR